MSNIYVYINIYINYKYYIYILQILYIYYSFFKTEILPYLKIKILSIFRKWNSLFSPKLTFFLESDTLFCFESEILLPLQVRFCFILQFRFCFTFKLRLSLMGYRTYTIKSVCFKNFIFQLRKYLILYRHKGTRRLFPCDLFLLKFWIRIFLL